MDNIYSFRLLAPSLKNLLDDLGATNILKKVVSYNQQKQEFE